MRTSIASPRNDVIRRSVLVLVLVLVTIALLIAPCSYCEAVAADDSNTVIDIGSRREVFVDGLLIERLGGDAELQMHHPVPREEVMVWDQPWEGNTTGYATVIQDGDLYRMFYRGWQYRIEPGTFNQKHSATLCYAESHDGIHWTRPELGLVGYPGPTGSKQNNIVLLGGKVGELRFDPSTFMVLRDNNPACAPDARFKGLVMATPFDRESTTLPKRGLLPFKSPDGLRWTPLVEKMVITGDAFDAPNLGFWDSERGEYRAYWRYVTKGDSGDSVPGSRRDIKTATSKDFVNWTEGVKLQYPGAPEEQLYTNQIKPYYRAPHILIGLPTRYIDRGVTDSISALPDKEHRDLRASGLLRAATALTDTLLMSSRDRVKFHRWQEAFLRPGIERSGTWAYGDHYASWQIVETRSALAGAPNEISLYATENYWTGKGSSLRRYTLRLDGFASASAPMSGGEIVTKPIRFDGDQLALNFSTSAAGGVQVEIQDDSGKPWPGFSLADCSPIFGDSIERIVTWKSGADVSALAGKPVRLRFVLKDADVFAFQFTAVDAARK